LESTYYSDKVKRKLDIQYPTRNTVSYFVVMQNIYSINAPFRIGGGVQRLAALQE
jgi:hypothetical protein